MNPIRSERKKQKSFRLPQDTIRKLVELANQQRRSEANVVEIAIERYYEEEKKKCSKKS